MPENDLLELLGEPENAPVKESKDIDIVSILGEPENDPPEVDVSDKKEAAPKEPAYIEGIYNEVVKDIDKEEYKPAYKQAIVDLEEKYRGMGGMTPIAKMQEFEKRMSDYALKASDSFLTENVDEETFNAYKKNVMTEADKLADELALDINEKGQVQPYADEMEKYSSDLSNSLLATRQDIDEESAAGFWESLKNKVSSGTRSLYGSTMDLIGTTTGLNYFDSFKEASEGQKFYADYFRELPTKYDGTVQDNLERGDLVGAGAATALAVGESLPRMLPAFMNPVYGIAVISAEAGLDKYRELEDKDMPEWEKIYNATLTGLNEYVWERAITVPILNRSKQAISKLGKDQAGTVIQKTVKNSLERNFNKAGGAMPQWMEEGLSEVATGLSNDITDKVTSDPNTKIGSHVIDDFVVGSAMGKLFSAPQDIVRSVEQARPLIESVLKKIPSSSPIGEKIDVATLMAERDALKEEEGTLDEAYKGKNTSRIEELDTEINNIVEQKTKEDELQQRDVKEPIEDRQRQGVQRVSGEEVSEAPPTIDGKEELDQVLEEEGAVKEAPPTSTLKEAAAKEVVEKPKVRQVKEFSKKEQDVISADNQIVVAVDTYDQFRNKDKLSKEEQVIFDRSKRILFDPKAKLEIDSSGDKTIVTRDGNVIKQKAIPVPSEGKHKSDYDIDTQGVIDQIISDPNLDMIELSNRPHSLDNAVKSVKEGRVNKDADALLKSIDDIINNDGAVVFESKDVAGRKNKKFVSIDDITGEVLPAESFKEDIVTQIAKEKPTSEQILTDIDQLGVKKQEAKDKIAEGFSDLATLLGTKQSITGDKRSNVVDAVRKISEGLTEYASAKGLELAKVVKDRLSSMGYEVDDDIINEAIKPKGDAKKADVVRKEGEVPTEEQIKKEEGEPVRRVREGDRTKATQEGKEISRFGLRVKLDDSNVSEAAKEKFDEHYEPRSHKEASEIAQAMFDQNDLDTAVETFLAGGFHNDIRGFLGAKINKALRNAIYKAEAAGLQGEVDRMVDQQLAIYELYKDELSVEAARGLRALGAEEIVQEFAAATSIKSYSNDAEKTREAEKGSKPFKKKSGRLIKDLDKSKDDSVDKTISSKGYDEAKNKAIKGTKRRTTTKRKKRASKADVSARLDRLGIKKQKAKDKVANGLDKIASAMGTKLSFTGDERASIIEGIQEVAEGLSEYAVTKGLELAELVKEQLSSFGYDLDDDIINEALTGEVQQKEPVDKLAKRIMGQVVESKKKTDPVQAMINTLVSKFKERDVKKSRKMKTDLERVTEAIRDRENYIDVWTEARDKAFSLVEENTKLSEEQKDDAIKRINTAYENATQLPFSDAQLRGAVRKQMGDMDMTIDDVVRSHYDVQSANKQALIDALVLESGLDEEGATYLANAVDKEFRRLMSLQGKKIMDKYVGKLKGRGTSKAAKDADLTQKKTSAQEMLELISMGAFDNLEFLDAYATAIGIPDINDIHVKEIKRLADHVHRVKSERLKTEATRKLLDYVADIKGITWTEMGDAIWYSFVLSGLSTQTRNFLGASLGIITGLLTETFTPAVTRKGRGISVSYSPIVDTMVMLEGLFRGFKYGGKTFTDIMKTGSVPFETKTEAAPLAERLTEYPTLDKLKYVGRIMNANDGFWITAGKEAWATLFAFEALKVNKWKYLYSPEYRRNTKKLVENNLGISKDQIDQFKKDIEADAKEFGYSKIEKQRVLFEKIDLARGKDIVDESIDYAQTSTGNVKTYGTIGAMTDLLAKTLSKAGILSSKTKAGIPVLSKVMAFTRIASNVATNSLDWTPVGFFRAKVGRYGILLRYLPTTKQYIREMSPRRRVTALKRAVLGTLAQGLLYAFAVPDDDEDTFIKITANGTGDWGKNKELEGAGWKPYSIYIGDKRISYRYSPMFLALAPLGFVSDAKRYRKQADAADDELLGMALAATPSMIMDMTALSQASALAETLSGGMTDPNAGSRISRFFSNIARGYYAPGIFRDVERLYDFAADNNMKRNDSTWDRMSINTAAGLLDKSDRQDVIDYFGRAVKQKIFLDEFIGTGKNVDSVTRYHIENNGPISIPDDNRTTFNLIQKDGEMVTRPLEIGDRRESMIWTIFVKARGNYLLREAKDLKEKGIVGEEYQEAMESAQLKATKEGKMAVEMYVSDNPVNSID